MQLDKRPAVNHILQYPARVLHHFNKSRLSLISFRSRLASLGMSAAASWFCNSAMFALTFSAIARGPSSRSEEHTSELQSLMRISYAVFCLKKKKNYTHHHYALYNHSN